MYQKQQLPLLIYSPGYFWHDAKNTAIMPKIKIKKCQKLATLKVSFFDMKKLLNHV